MCGIVGMISNLPVQNQLLEKLKLLEYRGYDSSGISLQSNGEIITKKSIGSISCLENSLTDFSSSSKCGIAHTRWATHGTATLENAHPHTDNNCEWAIVHNGIITNYLKIKLDLQKFGTNFYSNTDSEIIPNLLKASKKQDNLSKLNDLTKQLKGSYALACINKFEKDTLYIAKNQSPLYICKCETCTIVASDPMCFAGHSDCYYSLHDNDYCKITTQDIKIYNNGKAVKRNKDKLLNIDTIISKNQYSHFMLKEIYETPTVLNNLLETYKKFFFKNKKIIKLFKKINKIYIVGCGTAYHSCQMGEKYLNEVLKCPVNAYVASEFIFENLLIDNKTLCIAVSQSGETADTILAVKKAKNKAAKCLCITNVDYSTLSKMCEIVLPICAGKEIAVASTKAYVCQLASFYLLAQYLHNKNIENGVASLRKIIQEMPNIFKLNLDHIAERLQDCTKIMLLGRQKDLITAEEASLKVKEITYINSIAYASGELKHGCLALIEKDTPVIVFASEVDTYEKNISSAQEAHARGAKIILLSQFQVENDFEYNIILPKCPQDLMPLISIIPMQILAYKLCLRKGLNPDKPRNLAKSVTVE